MTERFTAIYARVSTQRQDLRAQNPDLKRWEAAQAAPCRWYTDKESGSTMARAARPRVLIEPGVTRKTTWPASGWGSTVFRIHIASIIPSAFRPPDETSSDQRP